MRTKVSLQTVLANFAAATNRTNIQNRTESTSSFNEMSMEPGMSGLFVLCLWTDPFAKLLMKPDTSQPVVFFPLKLQTSSCRAHSYKTFISSQNVGSYNGTLTEGEGSVHLTSSLRYLVLFNIKRSRSKLVSTRRSNVPSLPLQ